MDGEEEEEAKQISGKVPSTQPAGQDDSDFDRAMTVQEQERASSLLFTINSESESDECTDDDADDDYDDEELFEAEILYPEEEDINNNEDMEEDELDLDDMSYEELIALGEIVGEVNKGLSADVLATSLRPYEYKCNSEDKNGLDRCVVCQVEYEEGESLVVLPCEHPYHSECVSKWLLIKKVCPICNTEVSSSSHENTT